MCGYVISCHITASWVYTHHWLISSTSWFPGKHISCGQSLNAVKFWWGIWKGYPQDFMPISQNLISCIHLIEGIPSNLLSHHCASSNLHLVFLLRGLAILCLLWDSMGHDPEFWQIQLLCGDNFCSCTRHHWHVHTHSFSIYAMGIIAFTLLVQCCSAKAQNYRLQTTTLIYTVNFPALVLT